MERTVEYLKNRIKDIEADIKEAEKLMAISREAGIDTTQAETELVRLKDELNRLKVALEKAKG